MASQSVRAGGGARLEVAGSTRGAFVARGALAAGAAFGLAAVAPWVNRALAQENERSATGLGIKGPPGVRRDLAILDFALVLELLEAKFYDRALARVPDLSPSVAGLAEEIRDNEREHAQLLETSVELLGGDPGPRPKFNFDYSDERRFLKTAERLEETGVGAYNGAAPLLDSVEVLEVAGGIVQAEGRHTGAIRFERGRKIAPPFDQALPDNVVLTRALPFLGGSE